MGMIHRQDSFSGGVLDPSLWSKFGLAQYARGLRIAENFIITKYGTLLSRPGTKFIHNAKFANKKARLKVFDFSDDQNYIVEFGDQYVRFALPDGTPVPNNAPAFTVIGAGSPPWYSQGGESWSKTTVTGIGAKTIEGACKGAGTRYVAVGDNCAYTCDDGLTWTERVLLAYAWDVIWTGTRYIAPCSVGNIATSLDGITWTVAVKGGDATIYWQNAVIGKNGEIHVFGYKNAGGLQVWRTVSADGGVTWSAAAQITIDAALTNPHTSGAVWDSATSTYLVSAFYTKGGVNLAGVFAVADGSNVATLLFECPQGLGPTNTFMSLTRVNGVLYVMGHSCLYRSTDSGATWTRILMTFGDFHAINWINGMYCASGVGNISTSLDGVTWTERKGYYDAPPVGNGDIVVANITSITELSTPYFEVDLPRLRSSQTGDVMTLTHMKYPPKALKRIGGTAAAPSFIFTDLMPKKPTKVVQDVAVTTSAAADEDHPAREWEWVVTYTTKGQRESPPSAVCKTETGMVVLYPDRPVTIQWTGIPGTEYYFIYRGRNGIFGYVGMVKSTTNSTSTIYFFDDGQLPVYSDEPPAWTNPFETEFPAVSSFFQERQVFANQPSQPSRILLSSTGGYDDFDVPNVYKDDDPLDFLLASRRYEEIRGIINLGDLLILTSEAEWTLNGIQGEPLTYKSVDARPHSYNGCSWVEPIVIGREVLFVHSAGNEIRNMVRDSNGWASSNLSQFVETYFDGVTVVDWAYARRPFNIIWVVLSDGSLLSLTYDHEMKTLAWARHPPAAGDLYEAVAVMTEAGVDVPWFVVYRNGGRTIEKMTLRTHYGAIDDYCGLDAAVKYTGVLTTTITGLAHLNGKDVYVYGNGEPSGPYRVAGGQIINVPLTTKAWVGLQIRARLQTLDSPEARTKQRNVERVFLETTLNEHPTNSLVAQIKAGPDFADMQTFLAADQRDGIIEIHVDGTNTFGGVAAVELTDPIPLEIRGLTREIAVGG